MGGIATKASTVTFRNYVVDRVPSSGLNDPDKAEIRSLFDLVDASVDLVGAAVTLSSVVVKTTVALLNADLAHAANTLGIVWNDGTAANNGVYVKTGASGVGGWTLTSLTVPGALSSHLEDLAVAAEASATAAASSAAAALASQIAAAASALAALASQTAAANSAIVALAAESAAVAAAVASGISFFFDTKAEAVAALATIADGQNVEIFADETRGGDLTIYRRVAGVLVLKIDIVAGVANIATFGDFAGVNVPANVTAIRTGAWGPAGGGGANYRVSSSTDTTVWRDETGDGRFWELDEPSPWGKMFGAVVDPYPDAGTRTNSQAAFDAAVAWSLENANATVRWEPGPFIKDEETSLEGGDLSGALSGVVGSFNGARMVGSSPTLIRFKPASADIACLSMYGGSGEATGKAWLGFKVEAYEASDLDTTYHGRGYGLYIDGQDGAICAVDALNLKAGWRLGNSQPGSFTEGCKVFGEIRNCTIPVLLEVNGGENSLRENQLSGLIACQDLDAGDGIVILGTSQAAYPFNMSFDFEMEGGVAHTPNVMRVVNCNGESMRGTLRIEGKAALKSDNLSTVEGLEFTSINGPAELIYRGTLGRYKNRSSRGARQISSPYPEFTDPHLAGMKAGGLLDLDANKPNTSGGSIMPYTGAGELGVIVTGFNGRLVLAEGPFGDELHELVDGMDLFTDGTKIRSHAASLDISADGGSGQLVFADGAVGGKIGRIPSTQTVAGTGTYDLADNSGGPTALYEVSHCKVVIKGPGAPTMSTNFIASFVFDWCLDGFGGPGHIANFAQLHYAPRAGTTMPDISSFAVTAAGVLRVSVVSNESLDITYTDLTAGNMRTA